MNYSVDYATESIEGDLKRLTDGEFAVVDAVFDLAENDPEVLESLSICTFRRVNPPPRFDASYVGSWTKEGYNIGYLKLWCDDGELIPWRIIYGVDHTPSAPRIIFLGIMPREDDYKFESVFADRIKKDYDHHRIPHIPRQV